MVVIPSRPEQLGVLHDQELHMILLYNEIHVISRELKPA